MIHDLPEGQTHFDEVAELRGQVIKLAGELYQLHVENAALRTRCEEQEKVIEVARGALSLIAKESKMEMGCYYRNQTNIERAQEALAAMKGKT